MGVLLAAPGEVTGIKLFLPEPADLFWSLVVIVITGVVFYKMVLPKMNAVLDQRKELVEGGIKKAEEAQDAADQMMANRQQMMDQAKADAAAARNEARDQAKEILKASKVKADEEAARITETAARQIAADRQAAEVALRGHVGQLATELASKIVGEALATEAARSSMVDQFLDELEAAPTAAP
jgi:F-type H+-transporting ATPase subunit b